MGPREFGIEPLRWKRIGEDPRRWKEIGEEPLRWKEMGEDPLRWNEMGEEPLLWSEAGVESRLYVVLGVTVLYVLYVLLSQPCRLMMTSLVTSLVTLKTEKMLIRSRNRVNRGIT